MSHPRRILLVSSLEAPHTGWSRLLQELADVFAERGLSPHLLFVEDRKDDRGVPFCEGKFGEHRGTCLLRNRVAQPRFNDLFVNAAWEDALRLFLISNQAVDGPFEFAIVHRWRGHGLKLPQLLRRFGIPTMLALPDAWPVCARGGLIASDESLCDDAQGERCGECVRTAWPSRFDAMQDVQSLSEAQMRRARIDLEIPELLWLPNEGLRPALSSAGVAASRCVNLRPSLSSSDGAREVVANAATARADATRRIGVCAPFVQASRLERVIEAATRLGEGYEFELLVDRKQSSDAADAATRTRLEAEIATVPNVALLDALDFEERVATWDLYLDPQSLGDPLATHAQQAIECGAFVIAQRRSSAAWWIDDGVNGLLLEDDSPETLAEEIVSSLELMDRSESSPPAAAGLAPEALVDAMLPLLERLRLPEGCPKGTSHWNADLSERVLLAPMPRGRVAIGLRWQEGSWQALSTPRVLYDDGLILPELERMFADSSA